MADKGLLLGAVSISTTLTPDSLGSISAVKDANKRLLDKHFGKISDAYLKRLEYMLKPGGTQDVGATGKASTNFTVDKLVSNYGNAYVIIREGSATKANAIMRAGVPSGGWQDIDNLKRWAAARRISLSHPEEKGKAGGKSAVLDVIGAGRGNPRSRFSGKVGQKTQTYSPKQITGAALGAIKQALHDYGTNRPGTAGRMGANWLKKYPYSSGRFDYPVVAFTHQKQFNDKVLFDLAESFVSVVVDKVLFSGKQAGYRRYS